MPKKGLVLPLGTNPDTGSVEGLLMEDGVLYRASLREIKEGTPIYGDSLMTLTPHPSNDRVMVSERHSIGPAKVNSPTYKEGWDRIFGSHTVGEA